MTNASSDDDHDDDNLSDRDREKLTRGECVTCGYRGFILGPRGGVAQNIECGNRECRARFNVTTFGGAVVMAQRIPREREGGSSWPSSDRPQGTFS